MRRVGEVSHGKSSGPLLGVAAVGAIVEQPGVQQVVLVAGPVVLKKIVGKNILNKTRTQTQTQTHAKLNKLKGRGGEVESFFFFFKIVFRSSALILAQ